MIWSIYFSIATLEPHGAVNGTEEEKPAAIFGNSSGIFGGNSSFSFADLAKKSPGGGFASKSGTHGYFNPTHAKR